MTAEAVSWARVIKNVLRREELVAGPGPVRGDEEKAAFEFDTDTGVWRVTVEKVI